MYKCFPWRKRVSEAILQYFLRKRINLYSSILYKARSAFNFPEIEPASDKKALRDQR
jgi:hypothetical protein